MIHRSVQRRRVTTSLTTLVVAAACAAALVSCGGDNDDADSGTTVGATPSAPDTASFSGTHPTSLESLAESARAAASAAASSASARASEFEASVSAEVERANQAAERELKDVTGRGNATADVTLTGKPRSQTGGLLAVVVNMRNSTDRAASYAVQVDFRDPDGKVVETRYVGAEDLEPGERAQPLAISRKPPEPVLTAEIAKAQRY